MYTPGMYVKNDPGVKTRGENYKTQFQATLDRVVKLLEDMKDKPVGERISVLTKEYLTTEDIVFVIERGEENLKLYPFGVQGAKVAEFRLDSEINSDAVKRALKSFLACARKEEAKQREAAARPRLEALHAT